MSATVSSPAAAPVLLKTPLHALHQELGARMVPFAGYSMPVQYPAGLMAEHHHTRAAAGLFDVSHMGQLRLVGPDAAAAFETLVPVDVIDLPMGRQRYGLLLTDDGGIIDDLMFVNLGNALGKGITREANPVASVGATAAVKGRPEQGSAPSGGSEAHAVASVGASSDAGPPQVGTAPSGGSEAHAVVERGGHIFIVVNGACKEGDIAHIQALIGHRCQVVPMPERALLALQGPKAVDALSRLSPGIEQLVFMSGGDAMVAGLPCFVTRSGYTGEDGFEISVHQDHAEALARALLAQPEVKPVGLGARNSLRLEAGLCLYGNDIDVRTTPVEAGLGWAIQKVRRAGGGRSGGFPGATKILAQLAGGASAPALKRVGLVAMERIPVREHTELQDAHGQRVGEVTSGLLAPSADQPIAMAYVSATCAVIGTRVSAMVRGKPVPMVVSAMPFVPHRYVRGQAR
jgi:aminomethyltransferase